VVVVLLGVLCLGAASGALAQDVTAFEVPGTNTGPRYLAAGPDGNLWFSEWDKHAIGRITPAGVITEFPLRPVSDGPLSPLNITAGPDGNLWFATGIWYSYKWQSTPRIGRITTAGVAATFPVPAQPQTIAAGSDGALWFGEEGSSKVARITTQGVVTEFPTHMDGTVGSMAAGPDGALWFTQVENDRIGRITVEGVAREITRSATVTDVAIRQIVAGSDGNLWALDGAHGTIRRITPAGVITDFPIRGSEGCLHGITAGPDGNVWFTEGYGPTHDKIGKISTTGAVTHFPLPSDTFGACGDTAPVVSGPDGAIWFVDRANRILRVRVEGQ
jgi:streptogramin lyase